MSDSNNEPSRVAPVRTPLRRARMMATLMALTAVFAAWSAAQPWWSFEVSNLTPVSSDLQTLPAVSASAEVSALDVSVRQPAPEVTAFGPTPSAPAPQPGTMFGLPRAAGLLLAAAAFVVVGTLVRVSLVPALGLVCALFAWTANQQMIAMVENPTFGGGFVTRLGNVGAFTAAAAVCIGFALVSAAQVWVANAPARAEARERAKASGLPAVGLLGAVATMVGAQLGRFDRGSDPRTPERG